jgi:hypothetical protein
VSAPVKLTAAQRRALLAIEANGGRTAPHASTVAVLRGGLATVNADPTHPHKFVLTDPGRAALAASKDGAK